MTTNSTKSDSVLKECPFCGGAGDFRDAYTHTKHGQFYQVCCVECDCSAGSWQPKAQAISTWNTRYSKYKLTNKDIEPFMPGGMGTIDESTLSPDHLKALSMMVGGED